MNRIENRKRIALVTDRFSIGGGLEHILQIVRGMPDFQFGVFAEGGQFHDEFDRLSNVFISPNGYHAEQINEFQPSIIHFHHLKPIFRYFLSPNRNDRIKVIFTAHGLHIHKYEFRTGIQNKINFKLRYNLERFLFNRADQIISVSREDREYIQQNYRNDDCIYIPNGIDTQNIEEITGSREDLRKVLHMPPHKILFLTAARFHFQKGYDILLKGIKQLSENAGLPDYQFILAGNGEELVDIKKLACQFDLSDKIRFLGPRKDIYKLMKACDYFVLPSRWEGLPITLIESALCRLPMIVSDTYGNRELVKHGETGIIFANTNPASLATRLKEVLQNKYPTTELAQDAYDFVLQNYTIAHMVEKLRKLYQQFV